MVKKLLNVLLLYDEKTDKEEQQRIGEGAQSIRADEETRNITAKELKKAFFRWQRATD